MAEDNGRLNKLLIALIVVQVLDLATSITLKILEG